MMNKEQYLLVCIMEEASEVQKTCSKSIRFKAESQSWEFDGTNWESLRQEVLDLNVVFEELRKLKRKPILNFEEAYKRRAEKLAKMYEYMEESINLGILDK